MAKTLVELDFFGMEKQNNSNFCPSEQRTSIRGWQKAISKISPQLFNKVLAASEAQKANSSSMEKLPTFPIMRPTSSFRYASDVPGTAPLTIFFNGRVNIFDVPQEKAKTIIKLAEDVGGLPMERSSDSILSIIQHQELSLLEKLRGDLPIARKMSLHTFLEKRKERLTSVWPYPSTSTTISSSHPSPSHRRVSEDKSKRNIQANEKKKMTKSRRVTSACNFQKSNC